MQEPTYEQHGKLKFWTLPDKEWLVDQYITQNKSAQQIGKEHNVGCGKVLDWLHKLNISTRTQEERNLRQGRIFRGKNNPTYIGKSSRTQKVECHRAGKPCVCSWCEKEGELKPGKHETSTPTCSLDVHHKDHDSKNFDLNNLVYLCPKCHRLETALWHIRKSKKANVSVSNKIITIDFNV